MELVDSNKLEKATGPDSQQSDLVDDKYVDHCRYIQDKSIFYSL